MLTELLMQDERRAGREEGRIEGHKEGRIEERKESILERLTEIGPVPKEVHEKIMQENNLDTLRAWAKFAAKVDSIEQFIEKCRDCETE